MDYMESIKKLEEKWTINQQKHATNGEVVWLCSYHSCIGGITSEIRSLFGSINIRVTPEFNEI